MPTPTAPVVETPPERRDAGEKHLVFYLGADRFALPVRQVRGIVGYVDVTAEPNLPAHVRGVLRLHGRALPVMDLRSRFGLPRSNGQTAGDSCIVLVEVSSAQGAGRTVGMLVDQVGEVIRVEVDQIEPLPPVAGRGTPLRGVIGGDEQRAALVDVDGLLADAAGATVPSDPPQTRAA